MIKKTIIPIIEDVNGKKTATELIVDYRLFGFLLYRIRSISPKKYGVNDYDLRV